MFLFCFAGNCDVFDFFYSSNITFTIIIIINGNNDRFRFHATYTFQRVLGESFGVSL